MTNTVTNSVDKLFLKDPLPGISGVLEFISVAEFIIPVRNLKSEKTAVVDELEGTI